MSNRIPVKQITSWSYSRYTDYVQCPLKAKLKHLDKIQEPPNDAMARGAKVHDDAAAYLKGVLKKLPAELKAIKDLLASIKKLMARKILSPIVEETWALRSDWTVTRWDDWKGCWSRIKVDAAYYEDETTLIIKDWKTGKLKADQHQAYLEQLELYGLGAFKTLPHVQTVKASLEYTDLGETHPAEGPLVFTRAKDEKRLQQLWEKRVKPMMSDKKFAPRPNDKCRWCFYRASNKDAGGGQCKY